MKKKEYSMSIKIGKKEFEKLNLLAKDLNLSQSDLIVLKVLKYNPMEYLEEKKSGHYILKTGIFCDGDLPCGKCIEMLTEYECDYCGRAYLGKDGEPCKHCNSDRKREKENLRNNKDNINPVVNLITPSKSIESTPPLSIEEDVEIRFPFLSKNPFIQPLPESYFNGELDNYGSSVKYMIDSGAMSAISSCYYCGKRIDAIRYGLDERFCKEEGSICKEKMYEIREKTDDIMIREGFLSDKLAGCMECGTMALKDLPWGNFCCLDHSKIYGK
jgi:hypothetical protein